MFANPYHCILHSQYLIQLKLSATATLGTEKSGHCREMVVVEAETTVNVQTVRLKKMAVVERWPLVEARVQSKTLVIISLKCLILRETFVNLENGTKDEEFNYPRSLSVRKAGLLMVCDSTNHRCLNCVESLLQSLEVRVVREESLCFQVQQQIPLMQRDIVICITPQSP